MAWIMTQYRVTASPVMMISGVVKQQRERYHHSSSGSVTSAVFIMLIS